MPPFILLLISGISTKQGWLAAKIAETAIFMSEKSSKCNGRHHAFGSVSSSERRSTTSEVEF